jgi:spore germination protein GerM
MPVAGDYMKQIAILIMLCLFVAGCSMMSEFQDWKAGDTPQSTEDPQIIIEDPVPSPPENTASAAEMKEIVLYFADETGTCLKQETRKIPKEEGLARATINQLIVGPMTSGLLPTIPVNTLLEDINIADGICTVDFSMELSSEHPGGLTNEELTVYSIVNTLTQFPSVEQVKILVNGKEVKTIAGHVDVSQAMSRNVEIIK